MRRSVAGPIAAYMQRQAILSRHEDTREALAQIGARSGVAARFREVAFPMASVKEHQLRTETFARRSIPCDASASQRLARKLNASARPLIRTSQRVSIPPAANRRRCWTAVPGSECLLSARPWHQYRAVSWLDFQP